MQIIDDYLPKEQFEKIYKIFTSNRVKWEYVNVANPAADKVGMFSFNDMLYDIIHYYLYRSGQYLTNLSRMKFS